MNKGATLTAMGVTILAVGILIAAYSAFSLEPDPTESSVFEGEFRSEDGGWDNVDLEAGRYEIWVTDPAGNVSVTIRWIDSNYSHGLLIHKANTDDYDKVVRNEGTSYYRISSIILNEGEYQIESDGSVYVYLTEPLDEDLLNTGLIIGTIMLIAGIGMLIAGIVILVRPPSPEQDPRAVPVRGYRPPPPPPVHTYNDHRQYQPYPGYREHYPRPEDQRAGFRPSPSYHEYQMPMRDNRRRPPRW